MKVLIADDEVIIREGMAKVIPWAELGFTLLEPVSSAEAALQRIEMERPDILITDIRMNGMTGLELIALIAKQHVQLEFILLTGYDDFNYIQEAIRQNACDYLLKSSSPEEIIAAVERAKHRLIKSKEYKELKESEVKRDIDCLLQDTLKNGICPADQQHILNAVPVLRHPPYQLLLLDISLQDWDHLSTDQLWNGIADKKQFQYRDHLLIIVKRRQSLTDEEQLQSALKRISMYCGKPFFLSRISDSLQELPCLYKQTVSLLPYQWLMPEQCSINIEKVNMRKGVSYMESGAVHEKELVNCMKKGSEAELSKWLTQLLEWLFRHPDATPESIQFYIENLYRNCLRYMELLDKQQAYQNCQTIPPANQWFENPSEQLLQIFGTVLNQFKVYCHSRETYVEDSILYMKEHLGEQLSLQQVADRIPVHPNYLSDMIRKKTGKSYMEMLTDIRIEKAADYLLHTSIHIKQITELVGYHDRKYFTKVFKRHYAMTPTQYRSKHYVS